MKNSFKYYMLLFSITFAFVSLGFYGCKEQKIKKQAKKEVAATYYTCSMHPQVHEDKPGNCPICGMNLIKVSGKHDETLPTDSLIYYMAQPVSKVAVGDFAVIHSKEMGLKKKIIVNGSIAFDESGKNIVNSRITGRIDKLFINYQNQMLRKGQAIMKIYSQKIVSREKDLIQAVKDGNKSLIENIRNQLINLGMAKKEIDEVIRSQKVLKDITIYSQYSGIVRNLNKTKTDFEFSLKEGAYIQKGQPLFVMQSINKKWAILNVKVNDLKDIAVGDEVKLYSNSTPNGTLTAKIGFIPPYFSKNNQAVKVRVYLKQIPEQWRIGTLIKGTIIVHHKGIFIPKIAIVDLGTKDIVWIKKKGFKRIFLSKAIKTGWENEKYIEVLSGIGQQSEIAQSAKYMVGKKTIFNNENL